MRVLMPEIVFDGLQTESFCPDKVDTTISAVAPRCKIKHSITNHWITLPFVKM
jgi:hypothetical protein